MLPKIEVMEYARGTKTAPGKRRFGLAEAKQIGDALGIRWDKFNLRQFRMGLNVELEHGRRDPATDVMHDEPILTGKIALAHLSETPDYYTQLAALGQEADRASQIRAGIQN